METQTAQPMMKPIIKEKIHNLGVEITELFEAVNKLKDRLEPVLSYEEQAKVPAEKRREPNKISEYIQEATDRVASIRILINQIMERLEI